MEKQTKKKSYLKKLGEELESKSIKYFAFLISSLLFLIVILLLSPTNIGELLRKARNAEEDLVTLKHYLLEGQVVDCDSIPIAGLTFLLEGHDEETAQTNEGGFFSVYLKLPVDLSAVPVRFIDENNEEVYTTLFSLDQNKIENDLPLIYVIPEEMLNK